MWLNYDLNHINISRLESSFGRRLNFLSSKLSWELQQVRELKYHGRTAEIPLGISRRPSTEQYLRRGSSRLVISVGESYTWSENLYGMGSGAPGGSLYDPLIQTMFTIQGRLASYHRADLRTVCVPGNANVLMVSALERLLGELDQQGDLRQYQQILVLQQFTERGRCWKERGHLSCEWFNQWQNPHGVYCFDYYHSMELVQLQRLVSVLSRYQDLNLRCVAWRNFDPWIVELKDKPQNFIMVKTCMNEFKHLLHGHCPPPKLPVAFEHNRSLQGFENIARDKLDWIQQQLSLTEPLFDFDSHNRFRAHPLPEMTLMWSKYLRSQGANFD